jgi:DNA helicase-2/ATP-dependent DNA helicase PcrA
MSTETPPPRLSAAQRGVLERVDNPSITSAEQAAAVKHVGNCFLSACPGAGKTRTVGLRLAYHAAFHPDDSLAAVSHTNTAIDAIHAAARELTAVPEHYWVGTLHSFLLRYVVYPFGHLYMGCTDVPQVAGDERDWPDDIPDVAAHDDYPGCRVKAWKFDVHLGPRLTYQRPSDWPQPLTEDIIVGALTDWAKDTKRDCWRRGLLSFSDVLWVAYRVLDRHPQLAKAVAARFDELIIDEVQDTSELQLKCIEFLRGQETHPRLVIVGDLCQAVYEWSGATPAGLRQFADDQELEELELTANYRSSKRICAVTYRFSTRSRPDRAEGVNADAVEQPQLWRWQKSKPPELVERFRERLSEVGIPEEQAAVLTWTNALVDRLNGRKGSDGPRGSWLLRILGAAAVERDERTGPTGQTFRRLDRAVTFVAFGAGLPAHLTHEQRDDIRTASAQLLQDLPNVDGELRAWNLAARDTLGAVAAAVGEGSPARNVRSTMTDAAALAGVDAREALAPPPTALARTIHDAKGENLAAVLVVARDEDAVNWANSAWIDRPPMDTTEETRVAYVALTRAERLLVLAIPSGAADSVTAKLGRVGFVNSHCEVSGDA